MNFEKIWIFLDFFKFFAKNDQTLKENDFEWFQVLIKTNLCFLTDFVLSLNIRWHLFLGNLYLLTASSTFNSVRFNPWTALYIHFINHLLIIYLLFITFDYCMSYIKFITSSLSHRMGHFWKNPQLEKIHDFIRINPNYPDFNGFFQKKWIF